jgi:hypothetical protein
VRRKEPVKVYKQVVVARFFNISKLLPVQPILTHTKTMYRKLIRSSGHMFFARLLVGIDGFRSVPSDGKYSEDTSARTSSSDEVINEH